MEEPDQPQEIPTRVECPAAKDPAVRLCILAALLLAFGIWCLTDLREPPSEWSFGKINEVSAYLLKCSCCFSTIWSARIASAVVIG